MMKHLELLNSEIRRLILGLELKQMDAKDGYLEGLITGAKLVESLVQAWQTECSYNPYEHLNDPPLQLPKMKDDDYQ